jgi:ABC-type sugar transport system ATPase subunit
MRLTSALSNRSVVRQDSEPQGGFQLEDVSYRYPGHSSQVLRGVTLELPRSKFYAMVGPSGSGKSTLLRLLAGIDLPTSGTVQWRGQEVATIRPRDRNIGIVFQDAPLFPERTVEAVVRFPLDSGRAARTPDAEDSVKLALDLLGLLPLRNRNPTTLSGGERQRVSLARLLVWKPEAMLLDEPLSAVDHDRRPDLIRLLRQIQREGGATVVYVTHDQIDVFAAADQVAVLTGGAIGHLGLPEEVYREPASVLVGRLVGDGSLSLIAGELTSLDDRDHHVITISPELAIHGRLRHASGNTGSIASGPICIGFRPEDIQLAKTSELSIPHPVNPWSIAEVNSCAFVGSRYLIKIDSPAGALLAWHHERLERGDSTLFSVKSSGLPLFRASGERLIGVFELMEADSP